MDSVEECTPFAKRLVEALQPHLDIPRGHWVIRRTYAGSVQRSHGAFESISEIRRAGQSAHARMVS